MSDFLLAGNGCTLVEEQHTGCAQRGQQECVRAENQQRNDRADAAGERGQMRFRALPLIDENDYKQRSHRKIDSC